MTEALRLTPGSMIVFEGLDRSGKSTQAQRLKNLNWHEPAPAFAHLPSGLTALTERIYRITEDVTATSSLALQLLHLACHAENIDHLIRAREHGVVLDRWWWSTVAYGWYGGGLGDSGLDEGIFFGLINAVWSPLPADVVFLFTTPYQRDELNRDSVRRGYAALAAQYPGLAVQVPSGDPQATTDFLLGSLRERGLLQAAS